MNYKITTLAENSVYGKGLQGEHGLSLLVEAGEHKVLFDTGASDLFIQNARLMGVDLTDVEFVILSHGHRDHTGGLHTFLKMNSRAKVVCKQEVFRRKFKNERENGMLHPEALDKSRFWLIDETTEIVPGVFAFPGVRIVDRNDTHFEHFFVEIGGEMRPDTFEDELALILKSEKSLSVLSACSHRGITNIIRAVQTSFPGLGLKLVMAVKSLNMSMVCNMRIDNGHLPPADTGADIAHPVVVTNMFVLVIGVGFTCLRSIKENLLLGLFVPADERTASRCGNHLIAVETQYAVSAERAEHPTVETAAEPLGRICDHGNPVTVGDLHDPVNPVRHPVKGDRNDRLRFAPCFGNAIRDSRFEQVGIQVPCLTLGIDKHGRRTEIGNGMTRSTECKRLHQHLIARPDAAGQQRQMYRRRPRRQTDDRFILRFGTLATIDEPFEVGLEPIDIRPHRHHPIGIESLLYKLLLLSRHMGETEINTIAFHFNFGNSADS